MNPIGSGKAMAMFARSAAHARRGSTSGGAVGLHTSPDWAKISDNWAKICNGMQSPPRDDDYYKVGCPETKLYVYHPSSQPVYHRAVLDNQALRIELMKKLRSNVEAIIKEKQQQQQEEEE